MELLSSLELWREWGSLPPLLGQRDPNKTRWKLTPAGKCPAQCRALSGCSRNEPHSEPTAGGLGPFPKWRVSIVSASQLAGQIFQAVGSLLSRIYFVSPTRSRTKEGPRDTWRLEQRKDAPILSSKETTEKPTCSPPASCPSQTQP